MGEAMYEGIELHEAPDSRPALPKHRALARTTLTERRAVAGSPCTHDQAARALPNERTMTELRSSLKTCLLDNP